MAAACLCCKSVRGFYYGTNGLHRFHNYTPKTRFVSYSVEMSWELVPLPTKSCSENILHLPVLCVVLERSYCDPLLSCFTVLFTALHFLLYIWSNRCTGQTLCCTFTVSWQLGFNTALALLPLAFIQHTVGVIAVCFISSIKECTVFSTYVCCIQGQFV